MRDLIDNLKHRSTQLAEVARDRSLGALGKVRDGSLDWHKTLEIRRAELVNGHEAPWYSLGGLQIRLLDRVDRTIELFSERVREEIARLQQLELGAGRSSVTPTASPVAKAGARPEKPAAKAKKPAAKAKRPAAKAKKPAAKAKKPAAKVQEATEGGSSRRFLLPIAGYDQMTAKEIVAEVGRLSHAQREVVRAHEASHKNRKTVLSALDTQEASS